MPFRFSIESNKTCILRMKKFTWKTNFPIRIHTVQCCNKQSEAIRMHAVFSLLHYQFVYHSICTKKAGNNTDKAIQIANQFLIKIAHK